MDTNRKPTGYCEIHREKYNFYCIECRCRLCSVCVNGLHPTIPPTHPNHDTLEILPTKSAIKKMRSDLMNRVESMSTMLNSVDYYDNDIDKQKLKLDFAWLARKHEIQQEFVSLHSMLIDREEELITDMEQDVQSALAEMSNLKKSKQKLEQKEIEIADECLCLVKERKLTLHRQEIFFKEQELLLDKCNHFIEKVKILPSTDDLWPLCLKMPFSMYNEKIYLDKCLQFTSFDSYNISAKEKVRYIPISQINHPVLCSDLICTTEAFPPSTSCTFDIEIHTPISDPVSYSSLAMDFCIFNSIGQMSLKPNALYLLVFHPIFTCVGNQGNISVVRGDNVCVMILTDCYISVTEEVKYIPWSKIKNKILCSDLICMAKPFPPSTVFTSDVVIRKQPFETKLYSSVSLDFCLFNSTEGTDLQPDTSYTVTFHPTFTYVGSQGYTSVTNDTSLSVLLLTGKKEDDSSDGSQSS